MNALELQAVVHDLWDTLVSSQFEESAWVGERLAAAVSEYLPVDTAAFAWGFDHDRGMEAPVEAGVCDGYADRDAARAFAHAAHVLNGGKYRMEHFRGGGANFQFGHRVAGVRVVFSFIVFDRGDVPRAKAYLADQIEAHRAT